MTITEEMLKKVMNQQGGVCKIFYKDTLQIIAPINHVKAFMEEIRKSNDKEHLINTVNKAIEDNIELMKSGNADSKKAIDFMQDIAIWFANEVLEGRAKLEEQQVN